MGLRIMQRRDLLWAGSGVLGALAVQRVALAKPQGQMVQLEQPTKPRGQMVQLGSKAQALPAYYVAPANAQPAPAIVVFMEAFGLNENIKGFCDRLADQGYAAIAPDIYHGQVFPYSDLQGAIAKLKTLKDDVVMREFGQSLEFLQTRSEVRPGGVGVTGFCMGGRYTFLANAVHAKRVKAAVSFYGGGIAATNDVAGRQSLLSQVAAMAAPLMLMYGSEDSYIMAEEHQRIAQALSVAKKRYSLNVFAGAGHGFMSDRRDSYNPAAAAEATAMMMAFFDRHLVGRK